MLPPAPPRFSTTTGCPIRSDTFWASVRATVSAKPPAAKPTTKCTGREGYACADASSGKASRRAARNRFVMLDPYLEDVVVGGLRVGHVDALQLDLEAASDF